jgi:hypothetical protein
VYPVSKVLKFETKTWKSFPVSFLSLFADFVPQDQIVTEVHINISILICPNAMTANVYVCAVVGL